MSETWNKPDARRSTRVPLKVTIRVMGQGDVFTCEGETIIVNLHGALIRTEVALVPGERIELHVFLTDKRCSARVIHVASEDEHQCGIELDEPRNVWGVSLPPEDWDEGGVEDHSR